MKIIKVLNHNTAVVEDAGQEKVVIGKGIAFQKKSGDALNASLVAKTFHLSNEKLNLQFQDILMDLPLEQISTVQKIVDEVRMNLGKKVSDSLYISLADHIHFCLMNYSKNIQLKNSLLFDIMHFYPDEYTLGKKALEIIEYENGVHLTDDEAGFIALHILSAEADDHVGTNNMFKATKIIEEILDVIRNFYDEEIIEGTLTWYRFINHLRYFCLRIVKRTIFDEDAKDEELLEILSSRYRDAYLCAVNVQRFIKAKYKADIGNEELLYLTIHIQRAMHQKGKENE